MGSIDSTSQLTAASSTGPFSLAFKARATLLVYHRTGVDAVPLSEGQSVVIGRDRQADVALPHAERLSRSHARFELVDGEVWVEDLDSTNGTLVAEEPVTRALVKPDTEVQLGSVVVGVHALEAGQGELQGLMRHDHFVRLLDAEIVRHRTFDRGFGLLMIQTSGGERQPLSRWSQRVRPHLRPVDCMAVYSPTAMEVVLIEVDEAALRRVAEAVANTRDKGQALLVVGGALFPANASSPEELIEAARTALHRASPTTPVQLASGSAATPAPAGEPVARSPKMLEVYESVQRVASAAFPVLISGETGTGKEVIARAIHERSDRRDRSLQCINCAAIPSQLLESIMFGHEKGAFTGADRRTDGVFAEADKGTVLLDEIGELPPAAQAALLRVLESKRITRVGSTKEQEVDVRILAATNRNLEAMCEAGGFRWDLLYRINAMTIQIPPLRERVEEIEPLAALFLEEANQANGTAVRGLEPGALEVLQGYGWPGNVRELRNVIHRAAVMAGEGAIAPQDLPEQLSGRRAPAPQPAEAPGSEALDFKDRVQRFETDLILSALEQARGNKSEASRNLRIPLRTLTHKIRTYGINVPR